MTTRSVDKPIIGNAKAENNMEDPAVLQRQIAFYSHVQVCATSRKARLEDLMQRKIAKTWDAAKKAKMVRRLMTANQELDQSVDALDQLKHRLEQVTTQAVVGNVAPFVPGPATSV
jgi:hypothetical protein